MPKATTRQTTPMLPQNPLVVATPTAKGADAAGDGKSLSPLGKHLAESRRRLRQAPRSRLHYIGERFEDFHRDGKGYKATCPAHDDSNPSLSISEGKDGRILIHCFAGCPTENILEAVGLRMADLYPDKPMIVATYDYRDEAGNLLFQVCRMDPKGFYQRRPDGNGGWVNDLKGVRPVLYRLPELLAADLAEPVFIVEGEKDADRLAALDMVATTNSGGAGKWKPEYSEALHGRNVVILPDNDNPGQTHSEQVAASLHGVAESVKVVELPGLPEKGDVSDWLDAGGTRFNLWFLAKQTPPYESTGQRDNATDEPLSCKPTGQRDTQRDEPLSCCPVEPLSGPVERFPVEVFPKILQRFITSVAEALPCPPDFPGAMMLPVLSTFIGRKRCIEIKPGWREYLVLWIMCIARSGDRKSPALEKVVETLRRLQRQLLAEYFAAKKAYASLPPDKQREEARPRLKQILTTDSTIEALKNVLAGNPNGIIFVADELTAWVRSHGQYKGGKGDDRQHWLSIWSGAQVVCNRVSLAEPIIINDPFVSVIGGVQPDALTDLIDDAREDGFSARILCSYPDPLPNRSWNEDTVKETSQYASVCESLWNLEPAPKPITFSPEAKAIWIDWVDRHRQESPSDNLRPTWSKAEGHCLRLALVLFLARQVCKETKATQIDPASITGAIKLIEYFKSHARKVYGRMADQKDDTRIGRALRWIKRYGGTVTARKAHMHALVKDTAEATELFEYLAELGYGTVTKESRNSVVFRLKDTTVQQVNESTGE